MKTILLEVSIFRTPIGISLIIALFFIAIYLTRYIFSIPILLKHQKAQTLLLLKIARSNGLTDEEFKNIKEIIEPDQSQRSRILSIKELTKGM